MEDAAELEASRDEQAQKLKHMMLAVAFKEACDKLTLEQRSQRLEMRHPLPHIPASLRRLRSSSLPRGQKQPRAEAAGPGAACVLLTGKRLPRLQSLLGEQEDDGTDELDESVLNALKYERDLDALRSFFEAAHEMLGMTPEECELEQPSRLDQAIAALSGNNSAESETAKELQQSKDELQQLQTDLEQVKVDGEAKLHDLDERIADTRYNLKCVSRVNELEYSLVVRWEMARVDQARIWGENAERAYLRDILDCKQRLSREQRVSQELRAFRAREMDDLQQRLTHWQQHYASEMKRMERETEALELRILEVTKSLAWHRAENAQHVRFVAEYQAKKDEEQRLLDLQQHRIDCAVRLQAWWRGTMVRRGLGPFKKKPKRGKRGKAAGQGGSKK